MATDYSYDLEVSKDTKTATLTVSLPGRTHAREPILEFDNKAALRLLDAKGLGHLVITDGPDTRLSNWSNGARKGVWTFGVESSTTTTVTADTTNTSNTNTATTTNTTSTKSNTRSRSKKTTK